MKRRGSGLRCRFPFRAPGWRMGLRALLFKTDAERDLDDELREYLEAAIEQKMSAGMSRADASRAARAEMGSVDAVKDRVRDVAWETRVETLVQDLRFAVRSFLRAPRFTIPALLALALGIGATSAIFSVVRGVMLKPLPYHEPDRVVAVWETNRTGNRNVIAPPTSSSGANGIDPSSIWAWSSRGAWP